ncbi:MAG TPA: hypothetical protein VJM09_10545 [Sphingobium sp.]|nr:hypothetical protein [Sphingobium sp.]
MAISRPQLQQRLPLVDREGRLSNEGLRALNDAFQSIFTTLDQIVELYGITDALNDDLTALASSGVVLSVAGGFPSGRVFTSTTTITITDGGAGSTITAAFSGDTDDVPEGANLYYTDARARLALSSGTGIAYNSGTGAIAVAANGVTDALLRQSAAFSVIGRSGNTTGNVADITAASDGQVLRRSGSTMGFGAVDLSSSGAVTGLLPVARGGTGAGSFISTKLLKGNGTGAFSSSSVSDNGASVVIDVGVGFSIGRFSVTSPVAADGNLYSGTYTPTLTNVSNVTTSIASPLQYMRVGNTVTVSGKIDIQPTALATSTQLGISLPIASNFANDYECGGTASAVGGAQEAAGIFADTTNDRAQLQFVSANTAQHRMMLSFTYQLV